MRALFTLALLALTTPAFAAPTADTPAFDRPTSERISDGIGMGLAATGGAIVGAYGGGLVGILLCDGGGLDCIGTAVLGAGVGLIGGFIGGARIFDGASDGDGSLWAAAGGATIGLAGAIALVQVDETGTLWLTAPLLVAAGAGLGYALFDSAPAIPSFAVLPDGQGGSQLSVALSGTF